MSLKTLKDSIKQAIKQNGNQEITGDTLQNTLLSMVDEQESHIGYDVFTGIISPNLVSVNDFSYDPNDYSISVNINMTELNLFRSNGERVKTIKFSSAPGLIKIPHYGTLALNLKDDTISVVTLGQPDTSDFVVLLQNEDVKTTQGLFAPLFREYYYKNFVKHSRFKNKTVVFFGDSITQQNLYVSEFKNKTGCTAINRGISGSTVTISATSGRNDSLCDRVDLSKSSSQGIPDADCIIVFAGINDWGQRVVWNIKLNKDNLQKPIDKTCFTGAFRYVLQKLRLTHPNSEIIVLGLHHVYSISTFSNWSEIKYENDDETNQFNYIIDDEGNTLQDWRDIQKKICNFYGVQFVDMTSCGFTPFLNSDYTQFTADGLHPNSEGAKMIVNNILKQIDYYA